MNPYVPLSEIELFTHVITDMANAIAERPGETQEQRFIRAQTASSLILGFAPTDMVQLMLAGHAVMFHAVIADSVGHTLRGEIDQVRRATRANMSRSTARCT